MHRKNGSVSIDSICTCKGRHMLFATFRKEVTCKIEVKVVIKKCQQYFEEMHAI